MSESWDLSQVPWEAILSEYQRRCARMIKNRPGKPRSCGHDRWVMSCECCRINFKRRQKLARQKTKSTK